MEHMDEQNLEKIVNEHQEYLLGRTIYQQSLFSWFSISARTACLQACAFS